MMIYSFNHPQNSWKEPHVHLFHNNPTSSIRKHSCWHIVMQPIILCSLLN